MAKFLEKKIAKDSKKTKQSAILINNFYNSIANGKSEKTENFCEKPLVENSFSEKEKHSSNRKTECQKLEESSFDKRSESDDSELTEASKFECKECGKYLNILSLPKHMQEIHHKKNPQIQCKCGKLISASSFYRHQMLHKRKKKKENKSFYIYKNTIISNLSKEEIVKELEEEIKRLKELKNKILIDQFEINREPQGKPIFKFNHTIN